MGETGALALGVALAAMASCTGMFFPLFIFSGASVLEALSVIIQVSPFKATKCVWRRGYRLFRMAPFHHHLQLWGIRAPVIVASAYAVTCLFRHLGYRQWTLQKRKICVLEFWGYRTFPPTLSCFHGRGGR